MTSVFDKASLKPNSHEKRKVTNGPKNYDSGKGVEDRLNQNHKKNPFILFKYLGAFSSHKYFTGMYVC